MDDEMQTYIDEVVAAAPPLSDSQRARFSGLLASTNSETDAVRPEFADLREVLSA